jgi:hypothetical protein
MEKLWRENKHTKLLNKLLKVVITVFKKMVSIKVDDLLASTSKNKSSSSTKKFVLD